MSSAKLSPRAGVIGWPIKHSRSPLIHRHWLKTYGRDGSYERYAVQPDDASAFFQSFADFGWVGCNVTVPHKETAYACAELRDASAKAVQAANTLWLENGKLCAANTDTYGFMEHLTQSQPHWRETTENVLILGAGGASRAIAYGFAEAGIANVNIANRTTARAIGLVESLGTKNLKPAAWDDRQKLARSADIIVNTTTLGMSTGNTDAESDDQAFPLGVDLSQRTSPSPAIVCDIVYVPLETPLLAHAKASGHKTVDGLGMLLHQAVPGFEKWYGIRPDVTPELRDIVLADLETPS
ncbi:MAG: shikimate dehydrogenase [Pseudomonadota bacterium]